MAVHLYVYAGIAIIVKGNAQTLNEPIGSDTNCFNGVLEGNCSKTTERAFVTRVNAGAKNASYYPDTCAPHWASTVADECCQREADDCYGEYAAVQTDPYVFHKDCIGKYKCTQRAAPRMDTLYHTHCNQAVYPTQTSYLDIEYYCIDVNKIASLSGNQKDNSSPGSVLYLWSGDTSTYASLPSTNQECSIETDCDGTFEILSIDFRFAKDDENLTCISEKSLTILDGGSSQMFNCTSNNDFEIKSLYTSLTNYITLSLENNVAGGYMWLAFNPTANGNLTVNCQAPGKTRDCIESTTNEATTTAFIQSTEKTTTDIKSTTSNQKTTTGGETATSDGVTATKNTHSTERTDPGQTQLKPEPNNSLFMFIGIAMGLMIVVVVAVIIGILVYRKKCRRQPDKKECHEENRAESENTTTVNGNGYVPEEKTKNPNNFPNNTLLSQQIQSNTNPNKVSDNENDYNAVPCSLTTDITQSSVPPVTVLLSNEDESYRGKEKKKKKKRKLNQIDVDNSIIVDNEIEENDDESKKKKKNKKERKKDGRKEKNESENNEESIKDKQQKHNVEQIEESNLINNIPQGDMAHEVQEHKEKTKKKKKKKHRYDANETENQQKETENTELINVNSNIALEDVAPIDQEHKERKKKKKRKKRRHEAETQQNETENMEEVELSEERQDMI